VKKKVHIYSGQFRKDLKPIQLRSDENGKIFWQERMFVCPDCLKNLKGHFRFTRTRAR
jgi:hypothetical protein